GDRRAGPIRAKASLLRIIAKGRALGNAGSSRATELYVQAIDDHLRSFAADPTAGEARWLLGQARQALGDPEGAAAAWSAIAADDPRWLDARLAIAAQQREEVEAAVEADEAREAASRAEAAR